MTEPEQVEIDVPADNAVFLAVSAGNYHDADMAFFKVRHEFAGRIITPAGQAHLDQLRQRRKDAYADLVAWVMTVEAERVGSRPEVTPVTSPAAVHAAAGARSALDECTGRTGCRADLHMFSCIARAEDGA